MLPQRFIVLLRPIPLVFLKPILGVLPRKARHVPVAPHFCDNRGGRDERHGLVSADNGLLKRKGARGAQPAVKQHAAGFRRDTEFAERPADGERERRGKPQSLNAPLPDKRGGQPTSSTRCGAAKALCPPLPLSPRKLFGVLDPAKKQTPPARADEARPDAERPRNGSAPDFVNTDDIRARHIRCGRSLRQEKDGDGERENDERHSP